MTDIFDFNIHLPCSLSTDVNQNILTDTTMNAIQLQKCFDAYECEFKNGFKAANFMVFNHEAVLENEFAIFTSNVKNRFPQSTITLLFDFRKYDEEHLEFAKNQGVDFVKFHSYVQKIQNEDFADVVKISKYAESLGMPILIDASYGTTKMYKYDNLHLAASILDEINKTPVVLLHSGGIRVLEAMLLADENSNVFLDTSLTLDYFNSSKLWDDLAYAYKKIGFERVLYGSDFPFVPITRSKAIFEEFCNKYSIDKDKQAVMFKKSTENLRNFGC